MLGAVRPKVRAFESIRFRENFFLFDMRFDQSPEAWIGDQLQGLLDRHPAPPALFLLGPFGEHSPDMELEHAHTKYAAQRFAVRVGPDRRGRNAPDHARFLEGLAPRRLDRRHGAIDIALGQRPAARMARCHQKYLARLSGRDRQDRHLRLRHRLLFSPPTGP